VVEETVEHGGGDRAITVEDGRPLFEGFVGGKDEPHTTKRTVNYQAVKSLLTRTKCVSAIHRVRLDWRFSLFESLFGLGP
jgi:hypothetical protein